MCSMASGIDMLAECLLGARTEGRRRLWREGPSKASAEAMFVAIDVECQC